MSKFPVVSLRAHIIQASFPIKFERHCPWMYHAISRKLICHLYTCIMRANDIVETRSRRNTQESIRIPRGAKKYAPLIKCDTRESCAIHKLHATRAHSNTTIVVLLCDASIFEKEKKKRFQRKKNCDDFNSLVFLSHAFQNLILFSDYLNFFLIFSYFIYSFI